jgi:hypothetical protein
VGTLGIAHRLTRTRELAMERPVSAMSAAGPERRRED